MRTPIVRLNRNGLYWLARWTVDGKRDWKSLGNVSHLSRRGAEVLCRQIQADLSISQIRGSVPRLGAWCEQYKRLRTDLSPGTRTLVDHTCRYLLAFFKHDPLIDRIARVETAEWRAALQRGELTDANRNTQTGPLAESTVAKHVRAAKRMFAEAGPNKLNLIRVDPFAHLSGRAPEIDKSWDTITPADLQKIMDECPGWNWKMLFALCRYCGLRRGEALRLQWVDVLFGENKLMVNARVRKGTKKRPRVCPIEPARLPTGVTKLLHDAHDAAAEGVAGVCEGISTTTLDQNARKIIARAGRVYSDPFHTLRRNREMELAAEYPMHVFAEWQGHSPEVAARYYLRVDESLYAPPKLAKKMAKRKAKLP